MALEWTGSGREAEDDITNGHFRAMEAELNMRNARPYAGHSARLAAPVHPERKSDSPAAGRMREHGHAHTHAEPVPAWLSIVWSASFNLQPVH
jgi:hypothetical protein